MYTHIAISYMAGQIEIVENATPAPKIPKAITVSGSFLYNAQSCWQRLEDLSQFVRLKSHATQMLQLYIQCHSKLTSLKSNKFSGLDIDLKNIMPQ